MALMVRSRFFFLLALFALHGTTLVRAADPEFFYDWTVSYSTISPLGVPKKVLFVHLLLVYFAHEECLATFHKFVLSR